MPYVPNATDTTEPLASQSVESAALEFRTLKTSITDRLEVVQSLIETTQAELDSEELARASGDTALSTRMDSFEEALASTGGGTGLPGMVYIQRFSGSVGLTAFTLDITPSSQTKVDAYINGIYQNHNTFTLVGGNVLTFTEAPTVGSQNIEVQIQYLVELTNGGVTAGSTTTFSGKTISLAGNTLTGTLAEFNVALSDADFATLAGGETLVNKTLTSPTLNNPTVFNYTEFVYAPAAGSVFTVNLTDGTIQKLTTNANTTITLPASAAGKNYAIIVAYGGVHTITWAGGGVLKWAGGAAPTATSVNGKFDIFVFTCDGTNTYGRSGGSNF